MPTAPTPVTNITTPVPLSTDPENFESRADLAWTELPVAIDEINDLGDVTYDNALEVFETASDIAAQALAAADAAGYVGKSTSTIAVSAGAKTVVLTAAKDNFAVNDRVFLVNRSDPSIRLVGTITTKTSSTQYTVTVTSGGVFGSGSYSSWLMIHGGFFSAAATATEVREGASDVVAMSPKSIYDGLAEVTLTDGANIYTDGDAALDMSKFINAAVTLEGNRALPNPTNATPGKTGRIRVIQDATGGRTLSFGSNWKRQGGDPTLTTTAAAIDIIAYDVVAADYILYDLIRNPS